MKLFNKRHTTKSEGIKVPELLILITFFTSEFSFLILTSSLNDILDTLKRERKYDQQFDPDALLIN